MEGETETATRTDRRSHRALAVVGTLAAVALLAVAVTNGLRDFGVGVDIGPVGTIKNTTVPVAGYCEAAVKTAWADSKKTPLWAVTVGTNMMGYTPVFGSEVKYTLLGNGRSLPGSLCRAEARHRLLVSAWLLFGALAIAILTIVLIRRSRRPPPTQPAISIAAP